ncbi:hypothetical protein HRR90_008723 [Exophiala dermatitidis]|uniref:XRCC4 coiled-coil domain-containing protein n=2 Tax=Exophiala dermatitidis TaxID=5970 RepID=H6BUV7_EXODN|nr:uncharacterized protein HMPREF1120_03086 [Exophiala dermatitidis NIH/UT8656]KAJ4508722.1 hypothetical protein HRR73_007389 [Exophiala dermatitidis]EHY54927.1 hypothetical protein HMPREF1120_03086 [Exophiala dermatitidis NIH/UT8656]KAJ4510969.1 hypothetical protein HRR75_005663 [Exophiala dermatitidis]KAJ4513371.1 hypothetical protein HRR74_006183 [Exophiala dermatitidis]KAJ4538078.1 hypothetical protein HRR77_007118 [Exophiala dermatitidis]
MADSSWVIRLEADNGANPILVKISRKEGGHDLDLDLLATDGDAAYAGKVRQRSLRKLRARNYDGSDDDWASIISHTLLLKQGHTISDAQKNNLDVACSTSGKDPNATLTINFRNKVEDITQKLGSIELPQTEETDDVDLFGWTLQAIQQRDHLYKNVETLSGQLKSKDQALKSLQKQIDELVEAKAEHEKQLLSKFTVLLNEKKLKIRNMQRVLSTAKADPSALREISSLIKNEEPAGPGRRSKRHADEAPAGDETDDSDAFETMQVDGVTNARQHRNREAHSPSSREITPTHSETADDDEPDDLGGARPAAERPKTRAASRKKQTAQKVPSPLPPRRELPFQKNRNGQSSDAHASRNQQGTPAAPAADDEETASEDDEL